MVHKHAWPSAEGREEGLIQAIMGTAAMIDDDTKRISAIYHPHPHSLIMNCLVEIDSFSPSPQVI
jgi:hypothetical protein